MRPVRGLVASALLLSGLSVPAAAAADERVIVQAVSTRVAAEAVRRAGGTVTRELSLVDGVAATLPAGARLAGVQAVTPDEAVRPTSLDSGGTGTAANVYRQSTQAVDLGPARQRVTVAVIDTGISKLGGLADNLKRVPDARVPGAYADCANFSAETSCEDSYGHGTFLAGLIAGDGPYPGMAPNAELVSVKIAGRDGSADTSQLLAALQYVVSWKDDLGIDVLNLSLGTASKHDHRRDPLNRAVERAWQAGIVVVVSASNLGPAGETISKPGDDPLVVTVGAVGDNGTAQRADDAIAPFSGRGPVRHGTPADSVTVYKPDVVAPGVGLVSLTVPGSRIDQTAQPSTVGVAGYRRGSGTSQAAAVVSGAVALLLERREWTPDEVKAALYVGAYRMEGGFAAVGAGQVDVTRSLGARVSGFRQALPRQDAFDGLDATRAGSLVTSFACGSVRQQVDGEGCTYVVGELMAQGVTEGVVARPQLLPFDAAEFADPAWQGQSWYGQSWYESQWVQGQSWYGQSWYGQSWYGQSWYEEPPSTTPGEGDLTDYGTVVRGSAWYGVWE